jgi:glycosyltransferase involved in cell wall biosynthesis
MTTIIQFYKILDAMGGAERLLIEEHRGFKQLGLRSKVVTCHLSQRIDSIARFGQGEVELISPGPFPLVAIRLARVLKRYPGAIVLCASGHIDLYAACLLTGHRYYLHAHHPAAMTTNIAETFSRLTRRHFECLVASNFGGRRLVEHDAKIGFLKRCALDIKCLLSSLSIKHAQGVFVLSDFAKREKKLLYGIEATVARGAIHGLRMRQGCESAHKIRGNRRMILSISRLYRDKRVDIVISGFAAAFQKEPDVVLVIGGTGEQLEPLKRLTSSLGIADRVIFAGFISDEELYGFYGSADLFVVIDWADFVITAFEALSVGTPVLVSSEGDYDEALRSSGYLHSSDPTPEAVGLGMATALRKTTRNPAALATAMEAYTWNSLCQKIARRIESTNGA